MFRKGRPLQNHVRHASGTQRPGRGPSSNDTNNGKWAHGQASTRDRSRTAFRPQALKRRHNSHGTATRMSGFTCDGNRRHPQISTFGRGPVYGMSYAVVKCRVPPVPVTCHLPHCRQRLSGDGRARLDYSGLGQPGCGGVSVRWYESYARACRGVSGIPADQYSLLSESPRGARVVQAEGGVCSVVVRAWFTLPSANSAIVSQPSPTPNHVHKSFPAATRGIPNASSQWQLTGPEQATFGATARHERTREQNSSQSSRRSSTSRCVGLKLNNKVSMTANE